MTDTELIFEEPEDKVTGGAGSPVADWLARLRDHPGKWAKYPERMHPSTSGAVKRGAYSGIKAGEFDAKGRNHGDDNGKRRCDLFARFVGDPS